MYIFKYLMLPPHHDPVRDLRIAFDKRACCFGYRTAVKLDGTDLTSGGGSHSFTKAVD
jgi:hypothetical protein